MVLEMTVTEPEVLLCRRLDREEDMPYKTQVRIETEHGTFTVDVLIAECIVVEVDGSTHFFGRKCILKDRLRDHALESLGLMVLHFRNIDVYKNMPFVFGKIREAWRKVTVIT